MSWGGRPLDGLEQEESFCSSVVGLGDEGMVGEQGWEDLIYSWPGEEGNRGDKNPVMWFWGWLYTFPQVLIEGLVRLAIFAFFFFDSLSIACSVSNPECWPRKD